MVHLPLYTILIVGNRSTGKTTYIQRSMGMLFDETVDRRRAEFSNSSSAHLIPEPDPVCLHYLPVPNTDRVIRVIELNHVAGGYTPVPHEYIGLIRKVIIFASFDNEYSIQDFTFHANTYSFLEVPIEFVINKKDLLEHASPNVVNAVLAAGGLASVHLVSCKSDDNIANLLFFQEEDA